MSQVKFGHRMVFTLLEKSAIEREWTGSDGFSRSRTFFWAPRPAVGRYQKALEAMGTSTEKGKECLERFSSFVDIVADAIKKAYFKVGRVEGKVGGRFNTEFKSHLDDQLCHFLAPLLETQGQKFCVDLVEKGEHEFRVTVNAEKGSYDHSLPGSYSLYWAVSIKVTIVEVNTLEETAGLVVAKALGFEGCAQGKIDQLEIPEKLKEVIMGFLALPKMEIERNDITGPSWRGGGDEEWLGFGDEEWLNEEAFANFVDLAAHGDVGEGDGGEGDVSEGDGGEGNGGVGHINDWGEADSDFPVMSESWGGQVVWPEEDGEGDEEEELVPGEALAEDEVH